MGRERRRVSRRDLGEVSVLPSFGFLFFSSLFWVLNIRCNGESAS
jgi:hypothetical protein